MYKKSLIIVATICATLTCMVVALQYQIHQLQNKDYTKTLVRNVCEVSRTTNKMHEQTCADLQDYYRLQYTCEQRNSSPLNKCKVEYK